MSSAVQAQPLYDNVDGVTPVVTIAGYVAVAGSVVTAVSQTAIPKEEDEADNPVDYDSKYSSLSRLVQRA